MKPTIPRAGSVEGIDMRAEDPETPVEELTRLSRHRSRSVRAAVAANANTSNDVLALLARVFPESVAGNPVLDWLLLEDANWLGRFDPLARQRLLMEPGTPVGLLWWAARFGEVEDKQAIAQNPDCPVEILAQLIDCGHPQVERAARAHVNMRPPNNPSVSPGLSMSDLNSGDWLTETSQWEGPSGTGLEISVLIDLGVVPPALFGPLLGGDVQVRRSIATSASAPTPVLTALLLDDDDVTRQSARQHCSVSPDAIRAVDALETGALQADLEVLDGMPLGSRAELFLARHPECPSVRLREFADNPNWRLREAAAANPSADLRIAVQLASDNDKDVRVALTTNPSVPPFLLGLLAEDRVEEVASSARRRLAYSHLGIGQATDGSETEGATFVHSEEGCDALMALLDSTAGVHVLLGRHPLAPAELLRSLSADPDWRVRVACAGNSSAPTDVLDRLLRDTDADVRAAALNNAATTDELVKNVADPAHPEVRRRLVHLATSSRQLEPYALDPASLVRLAVAEHELVGPLTLESLASDIDENVRRCVASKELLSRNAVTKLAADSEPGVQQLIAERNDLPDDAVVQLFHDRRSSTLAKRADQCRLLLSGISNSNRSDTALLRNAPSWLRQHVVRRSSDLALLTAMSTSDDWYTRACVAQHPLLTDSLLLKLAADSDYDVRTAIATLVRPLPHGVVHDLAQDPHTAVRAAILARHDLDQCVVEEMIYDDDDELRASVAAHPKLSERSRQIYLDLAERKPLAVSVLKELAGASPLSRRLVAQHPSTPPRILASLARDENWRVREDVARHPKATKAILQRLGLEADRDVRRAVASNRSASAELLRELIVDADDSVRIAASRHPRLPVHLRAEIQRAAMRKLARSTQPHDRLVFVASANCSALELQRRRHWQAPEWQIRLTVAVHVNTPASLVLRLCGDADHRVRNAAQRRLDQV